MVSHFWFLTLLKFDRTSGEGSAAQARSGGGERLAAGGVHDELVEGLANHGGRDATLCRCPDLGPPRVICVFDAAIGITAGQPLGRRPDVEAISAGTLENRSDNGRGAAAEPRCPSRGGADLLGVARPTDVEIRTPNQLK